MSGSAKRKCSRLGVSGPLVPAVVDEDTACLFVPDVGVSAVAAVVAAGALAEVLKADQQSEAAAWLAMMTSDDLWEGSYLLRIDEAQS